MQMDQKSGTGRQGDIRKPQSSSRQEWEFSPAPQFEIINSSVFLLLYVQLSQVRSLTCVGVWFPVSQQCRHGHKEGRGCSGSHSSPWLQGWRKYEWPAQRRNNSVETNHQRVFQMMGFYVSDWGNQEGWMGEDGVIWKQDDTSGLNRQWYLEHEYTGWLGYGCISPCLQLSMVTLGSAGFSWNLGLTCNSNMALAKWPDIVNYHCP